MELHEFISKTLSEILLGVSRAQIEMQQANHTGQGQGPAINPVKMVSGIQINDGLRNVDFDIAVTVTDSLEGTAGGKAGISVVGISGEVHQESSHSKVSRIKFQVPIRFAGLHF